MPLGREHAGDQDLEQDRPEREAVSGGAAVATAAMDRYNGRILILKSFLIYFAAPVVYVGIVQAALCDRLGASATVSNLPASTYLLGSVAPLVLSWLIPHRRTRTTLVVAYLVTMSAFLMVLATLVLPVSNTVRLWAVVGQGLIQGVSASVAHVYGFQCLKRGTTPKGRARALKWAYAVSPMAGVAGSLWAQFVLGGGIEGLAFPYDFGLLYLTGVPCMVAISVLSSRYRLLDIQEEKAPNLLPYLWRSLRSFWTLRILLLVWLAYFFWYLTINTMPNLSLFAREALSREPQELSGWMMALRFGFKCVGGFVLGVIAIRWGMRAPLLTCAVLVGAAVLWAWFIPGHLYLLAFGIMGAGELGGVYFPNYVISISSAADSTRNLAILGLVTPVSSLGPALHGGLADTLGFPASFLFGVTAALISLTLILRLSPQTSPVRPG